MNVSPGTRGPSSGGRGAQTGRTVATRPRLRSSDLKEKQKREPVCRLPGKTPLDKRLLDSCAAPTVSPAPTSDTQVCGPESAPRLRKQGPFEKSCRCSFICHKHSPVPCLTTCPLSFRLRRMNGDNAFSASSCDKYGAFTSRDGFCCCCTIKPL